MWGSHTAWFLRALGRSRLATSECSQHRLLQHPVHCLSQLQRYMAHTTCPSVLQASPSRLICCTTHASTTKTGLLGFAASRMSLGSTIPSHSMAVQYQQRAGMAWVVKRAKQCRMKVTYPPKTKYKLKGYSSWKSRLRYNTETKEYTYTRPGRKRKRRKKTKTQMRRLKTPGTLTPAYAKVLRKYGFTLENS